MNTEKKYLAIARDVTDGRFIPADFFDISLYEASRRIGTHLNGEPSWVVVAAIEVEIPARDCWYEVHDTIDRNGLTHRFLIEAQRDQPEEGMVACDLCDAEIFAILWTYDVAPDGDFDDSTWVGDVVIGDYPCAIPEALANARERIESMKLLVQDLCRTFRL